MTSEMSMEKDRSRLFSLLVTFSPFSSASFFCSSPFCLSPSSLLVMLLASQISACSSPLCRSSSASPVLSLVAICSFSAFSLRIFSMREIARRRCRAAAASPETAHPTRTKR
ncbi:putative transmembrane protein [Toxoplasma gondii TgCatPRC2]|uniref:Putative transmembrane protein n=2 Tax=Toxoplasma gondii TaxID=5811 RepID=A0A151H0F6_TOXGO|nr:putative transmembrane protein [Toxoplasma gondii TgCatPRC2]PUA83715.1 putative transmembrane protein [Toxoplasma gondii TgCATBr9]